jgi:transposase-like protein
MNALNQKIIACTYVQKEGYKCTQPWFTELKQKDLNPTCIIMDGERSVIRAIKDVWPEAKIQRCLYHIQREGMRWLRTFPKTRAGQELRQLLKTICAIRNIKERKQFINKYAQWQKTHKDFVNQLPKGVVAYKDLKKTITLINNSLPNIFYYLNNQAIHSTTNALEGFYSRLKSDYRRHRGLSEKHKISYLKWYCYFRNTEK